MTWIYLSPHLDDAALSCGGLIAQQTLTGITAEIWTICAGDPPPGPFSPFAEELHTRWQTGREASAQRRQEDRTACARLSATCHYLPVPDCIYRRAGLDYWQQNDSSIPEVSAETGAYLYPDREAIFAALHPLEESLVRRVSKKLSEALPPDAEVICPLTLGGHVDHRLTREAAEALKRRLWYYADYPYVMQNQELLAALEANGWQRQRFYLSPAALEAWIQAVAAHQSQISTFWHDLSAMRAAILAYQAQFDGAVLWNKG